MGGGISSSLEPPPIFTRRVPKWEVAKMGGGISSSLETIIMVASLALAGLKRVFWTFGPFLVLSMVQTRAQNTRGGAPASFEPSSAP